MCYCHLKHLSLYTFLLVLYFIRVSQMHVSDVNTLKHNRLVDFKKSFNNIIKRISYLITILRVETT